MDNGNKIIRIYLDTSVYNRPFDEQTQARIALETLALTAILQLIDTDQAQLVTSAALAFENSKNPFPLCKKWVSDCIDQAWQYQKIDERITNRAKEIEAQGVKSMDALHAACAEAAKCDYFLTCDDRIIKRYKGSLQVKNPVDFILLQTGETW